MKKYVFLAPGINSVGGAQIYTRNKMIFLKEQGWDVNIFYYLDFEIIIDELKSIDTIVPELCYPPAYYNSIRCKKIIKDILKIIGDCTEIVFESHTVILALWGELLAKVCFGKHIVFLLQETFPVYSEGIYDYLYFKYQRRELAGITDFSIPKLFEHYSKANLSEGCKLIAACTNSIEQTRVHDESLIRDDYDLNIICVGRCEKKYVTNCVIKTNEYCGLHSDMKVNLIIAGGSKESSVIDELKNYVTERNLIMSITGFIFPIPQQLLEGATFVVAGSGSARCAVAIPALTISMDINGEPIGLLGITTDSALYAHTKSHLSLIEYYDDIYSGKYNVNDISQSIIDQAREYQDFRKQFVSHLEFLNQTSKEFVYYNTSKLCTDKKKLIAYKLLGSGLYVKIRSLIKKS